MPHDLPKSYEPGAIEARWAEYWIKEKLFSVATPPPGEKRPVFTLLLPPPNVTGRLHMGHMLNQTQMDIIVRWHRMRGFLTLWLPGTDHAGIATQMMVERQLASEGKERRDLGREKFVERVWEWKRHYGGAILEQMKRLGVSVDWNREYFTMDENLSRAVREVFVRLYEEGLICRGKYIVNWCPRCETAISDLEVKHEEVAGKLYEIRYPVIGTSEFITVATTRPETMLGDTAVAVNEKDERYRHLHGKKVLLPLMNREIPIITDELAQPEFGTGAVKVTPAHDPNDFQAGLRHNLPQIDVMDQNARMNQNAGAYAGLDRFEARKRVLEDLRAQGFLVGEKDYTISLGKCDRCGTVVEPRLSTRLLPFTTLGWPEKTRDQEVFYPTTLLITAYEILFFWVARMIMFGCHFMKGHKQDSVIKQAGGWCEKKDDSVPFRQVYIHALVRDAERQKMSKTKGNVIDPLEIIQRFGTDATRFTLAAMAAPGTDIAFSESRTEGYRNFANKIWNAARFMFLNIDRVGLDCVAAGLRPALDGAKPRPHTGIAGFQPVTLEDRWILSRFNRLAKDVNEALATYRFHEAANRIYDFFWGEFCDWYIELIKSRLRRAEPHNALARLVAGEDPNKIMAELRSNLAEVISELGPSKMADFRSKMEQFCKLLEQHSPKVAWPEKEFDDEMSKLRASVAADREVAGVACTNLLALFEASLRLLHPVLPFITEEIWQAIYDGKPPLKSIALAPYPQADEKQFDPVAETQMSILQDLIVNVRNLRAELKVEQKLKLPIQIFAHDPQIRTLLEQNINAIERLARVDNVTFVDESLSNLPASRHTAAFDVHVVYERKIDVAAECERLKKELEKIEKGIASGQRQLSNKQFLAKAPSNVVENLRKQQQELAALQTKMQGKMQELGCS